MDRHDVSDNVTAEIVAELHQADLKIQDKYNCRGITYWFDDVRKTAFCLIDAPNKQAIKRMHDDAHGEVPHHIIEVDKNIVESFLGRIEDPIKATNTELNIINDPAFRTILHVELSQFPLSNKKKQNFENLVLQVSHGLDSHEGRLVKKNNSYVLASFKSVSNALNCALAIQSNYNAPKGVTNSAGLNVHIGMYAGVPVTSSIGFFKETIKMASRFSFISNNNIIISTEIKDLFESECVENLVSYNNIRVCNLKQEQFLRDFFHYLESQWENPQLNVNEFCINLGFSKSQLYRNVIEMSGKSPNIFLKEYRLHKALALLEQNNLTIADIAYKTGFNSAAYFSKCFFNLFNILPSVYLKQ